MTNQKALDYHSKQNWKISVNSKVQLNSKDDLALAYSPWVAQPCLEIAKDEKLVNKYTSRWNLVAVISDWSAVLGLWNIWAKASLPVMEWKAILFKEFWDVDAFPICLDTQDTEEIIKTCKLLEPTFWWINLEDISAPRCFEIEERLKKEMNIPVFHDDQHWTAIVTLAWIINSAKVVWKNLKDLKIVISWAWAAWIAICKLLFSYWIQEFILCDSKWAIYKWRENLNPIKEKMAEITNKKNLKWGLWDIISWADVFIWVSQPWVLTKEMIKIMAKDPIVFAMANPIPEIMPDEAKKAWVAIIWTWRSDFPNQVNNVLWFPWIFRWVLDAWFTQITEEIKIVSAEAIANYVKNPTAEEVVPFAMDKWVSVAVADAIKKLK